MLKKFFDNLDVPDGEKEDLYVTEKIFKKDHRIGKNFKNQPSLLFKTKKSGDTSNIETLTVSPYNPIRTLIFLYNPIIIL